jgi:hypothetical protein
VTTELTSTAEQRKATNLELWGLYRTQRSAYLNVLYYGKRAATWAKWNLWLQIGASIGSLGAVTGFLATQGHDVGKWISAFVGAASAVCAALPAIMGHAEKVNKFEKLHFAYCELYHLTMRSALEIRRSRLVTEEQIGAAKMLNDIYSRLGQQDDPDRKDELAQECEKKVRDKFPDDSLWYATENGRKTGPQAEPTQTATERA